MERKVHFYLLNLTDYEDGKLANKTTIRDVIKKIIDDNSKTIVDNDAIENNSIAILDLSINEDLHCNADVFINDQKKLFLRLSKQNPNGAYIHRKYDTFKPNNILEGRGEDEEGIELYTYIYLDYATSTLAYVSRKGAPSSSYFQRLFIKYASEYMINMTEIPNYKGIDFFYNAEKKSVSSIEFQVPVPEPALLESLNWSSDDYIRAQSGRLMATVKLTCDVGNTIMNEKKTINKTIDSLKKYILPKATKLKVRGRADNEKTADYYFFQENFSHTIQVEEFYIEGGKKKYYSLSELTEKYRDALEKCISENSALLKSFH